MKRILSLLTVLILSFSSVQASPLVFKITKNVTTDGLFELATFDASKFSQIRIGIKISDRLPNDKHPTSKSSAALRLDIAKRDLQSKTELLKTGVISRSDYDKAKLELTLAQENFDKSVDLIYPNVNIFGIEGKEEVLLNTFDNKNNNFSFLIESPPSKISIKVFGQATYTVFIWASL